MGRAGVFEAHAKKASVTALIYKRNSAQLSNRHVGTTGDICGISIW